MDAEARKGFEQVRDWNREHKRIKKVLREMSAINEQIIRRHVRDQRQDRTVRRSLTRRNRPATASPS